MARRKGRKAAGEVKNIPGVTPTKRKVVKQTMVTLAQIQALEKIARGKKRDKDRFIKDTRNKKHPSPNMRKERKKRKSRY